MNIYSEPKQGATEDGQTAGSSIHVHGQISVPCVRDFEAVRIILKTSFKMYCPIRTITVKVWMLSEWHRIREIKRNLNPWSYDFQLELDKILISHKL